MLLFLNLFFMLIICFSCGDQTPQKSVITTPNKPIKRTYFTKNLDKEAISWLYNNLSNNNQDLPEIMADFKEKINKTDAKTRDDLIDRLVAKSLLQSGDVFKLVLKTNESPDIAKKNVKKAIKEHLLPTTPQTRKYVYKDDIDARALKPLKDIILQANNLGIAKDLFRDFDLWPGDKFIGSAWSRIFGDLFSEPVGKIAQGPLIYQIFLRLAQKNVEYSYRDFIKAMKQLAQQINIDWQAYVQRSMDLLKDEYKEQDLRQVFDI